MLVGRSRQELVKELEASFAEVCSSGSPRMWLLTAPSGWGKTRVVQEFYARLAADHQGAAYWPATIIDADNTPATASRKRISPAVTTVNSSAAIPWLWWGTQAFCMGDGTPGRALEQGTDQLYAHGEALILAERNWRGAVSDAFDATSATVGILALFVAALAAPPVGIPLAIAGGAKTAATIGWSRIRRMVERRRIEESGPVGAADQFEQKTIAQLIDRVHKLTKAVPIVLVVDDAHHADRVTMGVLDGLLRLPDARLLVVAMAWPDVVAETSDRPFTVWLQSTGGASTAARVRRAQLDALTQIDLAQIVESVAPATRPAVRRAFASRYDNPLSLRYVIDLPRVQRRVSQGCIDVQPDEVEALPATLPDIFNDAWGELPARIQSALAVAALTGERFVPELVVLAAEPYRLSFTLDDFAIAAQRHRWTAVVDRSLHGFVEASFCRVAAERAQDFLEDSETKAIRREQATLATNTDIAKSLSYRARLEVQAWYLGLVENAELPVDSHAVHVALSLGTADSLRGDLAGAEALYDRAAEWAAESDDRLHVAMQRAWLEGLKQNNQEAIAMLERALTAEPNAGKRSTLVARNDIAFWWRQLDPIRSTQMFRGLMETATRELGPDDGLTLTIRKNYADGLGALGQYAEARALTEPLIHDLTQVNGPNDTSTLIARGYHAFYVSELEGPEAAAKLALDVVPALIAELGPTEGPTLVNRLNLMRWLRDSGHGSRAERVCREAVADLDTYGSAPDTNADELRLGLADFDFQAGRFSAAADRISLALQTLSQPLTTPDALQSRSNLGFAYWHAGRLAEALTTYHGVLQDLNRTMPRDDRLVMQTSQNIVALSKQLSEN
jgi:tetratricopeptide (TPR) repeat protein